MNWLKRRFLKRLRRSFPQLAGQKSSGVTLNADLLDALGRAGVTVVIPVYNAPAELSACLNSVQRNTPKDVRVIVIDDASPDSRVQEILSEYRATPGFELYANGANLGFTRTINRGVELAARDDVILLNADTEVPPRWISRLQLACDSSERIGTATAMSNNAGAFSVPNKGVSNEIPIWLEFEDYARAVNQNSERRFPKTPTGNGFCMYIRRPCIDEVGSFDVDAFPRGYGEENDFCLRAGQLGWSHVLDDATLVLHHRSASFGEEKGPLMREGRRVIDKRYPHYTQAVDAFIHGSELKAVCKRIQSRVYSSSKSPSRARPRVLYVLSTRTGGTPQTNKDLMLALEDRVDPLVLWCDGKRLKLQRFQDGRCITVKKHSLSQAVTPFPHRSVDYDQVVAQWLVAFAVELVHVRHVARHGLGLFDVTRALRMPVVFSFHDFYTVCPTTNLLDEADRNCGGECTATPGVCRQPLWKNHEFPLLKHSAIHDWRREFALALNKCAAFVTASSSAVAVIRRNFPCLSDRKVHVIPHGRDFMEMGQLCERLVPEGPVRLLIPGNLSPAKGLRIVQKLCRVAPDHLLELHLLGTSTEELTGANVVNHGPYQRDDFVGKVKEIRPHLAAVPSICDETYCHTLTELWACGVPVIGFDLGAVGERIRKWGGGWLAPQTTSDAVLEVICRLRAEPQLQAAAINNVLHWQDSDGRRRDVQAMSHDYYDLYRSLLSSASKRGLDGLDVRPRVAVIAPNSTVTRYRLSRAPGSTHVRLGEKVLDQLDRRVRYDFIPNESEPEWLATAFDAVIVQRTALEERAAEELILRCAGKCPLIVELDDFLLSDDFGWSSYREYTGHRKALTKLLGAASLVMTSTEELKARLAPFSERIVVLPNVISERLWFAPFKEKSPTASLRGLDKPRREAETRVVYMGSRTHHDDLKMLKDAVLDLRSTNPNFRLLTLGITESPEPWHEPLKVPDGNYPSFVSWFRRVASLVDFAVAPLMDTEFNRAKSTIKLLEYTAAGLPVIASDVSPYRDEIANAVTGLLAQNSPSGWLEALRFACENQREMRKMSVRFREEVVTDRLISPQIPAFDAAILSTVQEFRRMSDQNGLSTRRRLQTLSVELLAEQSRAEEVQRCQNGQ